MKNKITLLTLALLISVGMFAQAPNLINYQGVARDINTGTPLISTPVNITFDIIQSSPGGTVVYSETHASSTNQFGLFNLEIGGGTPVTGTFAAINWSTGLYYLQITINGDVMPATQLLSVPFALHANTATSGTPGADGNDNLSVVTPEAPGANCAAGGNMVEVGVDDNANGSLEPGEVDFTYYVCNGLNGGAGNDTSATNELQTISVSNDTIFLTNGGFAILPNLGGDNDWTQGAGFVYNTSDDVRIGTSSPSPISGTKLYVQGSSLPAISVQKNGSTIGAPQFNFSKSNGTEASPTAVGTGDRLGDMYWHGYDGSNYEIGAWIRAEVSENWTPAGWGTDLLFITAQNGATTHQSRLTIKNDGKVGIGTVTPATKLDVAGLTQTDSLRVLNGAGNVGDVLTSDAAGNATWQSPSAGTDNQNLINSGKVVNNQTIDIQNGTGVTFSVADGDSSATNEIQNLSTTGNTINISGGTGTNISATAPNTGDYLYWNGVNWVAQTVSGDNWGTDVVNTTGANISGDGTSGNPLAVIDNDSSATNELQNLSISGNTINISNGTGISVSTNFPTTGDMLFWNGSDWTAQPVSGINVNDADADPTNELITTFSVNGTNDSLVIVEGGVGHAMPLSDLSDGDWTKGAGVIHNTSDNVGIGTASPSTKLEVAGGNILLRDQTNVVDAVELTSGSGAGASGSVGIRNSGVNAIFMSGVGSSWFNAGNFGIGNNSPSTKLHITDVAPTLRIQSSQTTTAASSIVEFGNTNAGIFNLQASVGVPGSGDYLNISNPNSFILFSTAVTERMRITNTGSIGVGTFSPFSLFDVNGQITMRTGATNGYIPVSDANGTMTWTDPSTIGAANDGDWIRYNNGTNDYLVNDNTHLVRVFGPSTSTASLQNNTSIFEIYANGGDRVMEVNGRNAAIGDIDGGGAGANVFVDGDGSGEISLNNFGTTAMIVKNTGKVGVGTVAPVGRFDVTTSTDLRGSQVQNSFTSANDKYGVYANASGGGAGDNVGIWGESFGSSTGISYGVGGQALSSGPENRAIYGSALSGTVNWAGYFDQGDVFIQNNLGINTSGLPSYPLHVEGNTQLNGVTQMNGSSGLSATLKVFGGLGAGVVYIFDGSGQKALSVFSGGQVGIGSGPTGTTGILHIQDNDANTTGASGSHINIQNLANATNTTSGIRFRTGGSTAVNGDSHYKGAIFFEDGTGSNGEGDMIFAVNNAANNTNATTADVAMVIESTLDVGIGIANPSAKLHVDATTTGQVGFFDNHTTTGGTGVRGDVSDNNATGTGTRYGVYGTGWYGQSTNRGGYFYGYGGTLAQGVYAYAAGGTTNYAGYFQGDVYTSGSYLPSDKKLKDNIQPYKGALAKLDQLTVRTYNYKRDGKFKNMQLPKGQQIGFIANELKNVFPQLTKKTVFDMAEFDEQGMPIDNHTPEYLEFDAVNYSGMVPVLVKAIQEQQQMIDELKQEIEDLKNQ